MPIGAVNIYIGYTYIIKHVLYIKRELSTMFSSTCVCNYISPGVELIKLHPCNWLPNHKFATILCPAVIPASI